jgi:succinate dehydrogenase / fumarate reductase membrane anchor subunit
MVTKVYTFKRTGIFDYLMVRLSAIIQALYFSVITYYWLMYMPLNYAQLVSFFDILLIKIGTLLVLVSISYHSIKGIHHIIEDYLTVARVGKSSNFLQISVLAFSYLQILGAFVCTIFIIF